LRAQATRREQTRPLAAGQRVYAGQSIPLTREVIPGRRTATRYTESVLAQIAVAKRRRGRALEHVGTQQAAGAGHQLAGVALATGRVHREKVVRESAGARDEPLRREGREARSPALLPLGRDQQDASGR